MVRTSPAHPDHLFSDEPARLDVDRIHGWLTRAYWSEGIPREVVERAIAGSMVFGVWGPEGQLAFARVITDRATFAYLADVVVDEAARGRGLGKWLVESILAHPELQGLRRFMLATRDAHSLYERYGFRLSPPGRMMEILDLEAYKRGRG